MHIEHASARDSAEIVAIIRAGFAEAWSYGRSDREALDATIYGCAGIHDYVAEHIRLGALSPYRYIVARPSGGAPSAAAEFRIFGDTLFLNYIAVRPEGQGSGAAGHILSKALAEASAAGLQRFALDVFTANARARSWYERLGLQTESERTFWMRSLDGAARASRFALPDLPQADAVHQRFGFSEFTLAAGGRSTKVGRLGSRYFRTGCLSTANDPGVRGFLREFAPERRLLAILEREPAELSEWTPLISAQRMSAEIRGLRR